MTGTNDIRKTFLDFFESNGHKHVASAPVVPLNDPTLLFTNAGMVPFKNLFTGAETRDYKRAVSSQKCIRAGGKHNDLDNVGYTARHHTFFEMLGNFSFGDYFKQEAIEYAWNLLTKEYGLDKNRLYVTVYHTDDQAYDLWKKIAGLPDERIIRIATNDNFWSMGETGPCGPCSEIFYDHGDHILGGPPGSPDEDGDRFVEIWNLVFMQYEQFGPDDRTDLPKPSIDTGMGLERIAAVMQGTHDNFETDTFKRLIEASVHETGVEASGDASASHRVMADHLRAVSFLIADGVLPSNEGRGYVLRRIMRRGMRHAHLLGMKDLLMYKLVPTLVNEMGAAFPELGRAQALIIETLKLEESRFRSMLDKGMHLLNAEVDKLGSGNILPGEVAFKLYDTYGFPLDLTEDALRSQNRTVDAEGFTSAMEAQKAKARAAWSGSGDASTEKLWFDLNDAHGATEFLGYTGTQAEGKIISLIIGGAVVDEAKKGSSVMLLANQTPFYAESGGQAGDCGTIKTSSGAIISVTDSQKKVGALHVHMGVVKEGTVSQSDVAEFIVDAGKRNQIRANHSATHVLHESLRRKLGEHVMQKGSHVAADRLRFDFSHTQSISKQDIDAIESDVNDILRQNSDVGTHLMSYDEAVDFGAMALFGEKYGDEVRVVSMGEDTDRDHKNYSVELCGGTHVNRLGDIGLFVIVSESAVASGVRRIEALTGSAALQYLKEQQSRLLEASAAIKTSSADLVERVKSLVSERRQFEKELGDAKKKLAMGGGSASGNEEVKEIKGIKFVGKILEGINPKDLRGLADDTKKTIGSGVVALVAVNDGKAAVLVGVTQDLTTTLSAVDLVKAGCAAVGGKGGGGRPDMAQAGGPDGANASEAIKAIEVILGS